MPGLFDCKRLERVLRVQFAMAEIIGPKRQQKSSDDAVHVPTSGKAVGRIHETKKKRPRTRRHARTVGSDSRGECRPRIVYRKLAKLLVTWSGNCGRGSRGCWLVN